MGGWAQQGGVCGAGWRRAGEEGRLGCAGGGRLGWLCRASALDFALRVEPGGSKPAQGGRRGCQRGQPPVSQKRSGWLKLPPFDGCLQFEAAAGVHGPALAAALNAMDATLAGQLKAMLDSAAWWLRVQRFLIGRRAGSTWRETQAAAKRQPTRHAVIGLHHATTSYLVGRPRSTQCHPGHM